jgi:hypothetical protein
MGSHRLLIAVSTLLALGPLPLAAQPSGAPEVVS